MTSRRHALALWVLLAAMTLACRGLVRLPPEETTAEVSLARPAAESLHHVDIAQHGLRFALPSSWEYQIAPRGVALYSARADIQAEQGALVTMQSLPVADVDLPEDNYSDSAHDLLMREISRWVFFAPATRFRMRQEATATTLNANEAARAVFHLQSDRYPPRQLPSLERSVETRFQPSPDDYWLSVYVTVVRVESQVVTVLAVTPVTLEERFAPHFEAIVNSLEVGPPAAADEGG